MLPSCGYFKNILCPFFKVGLCVRPHCHYKHAKSEDGEEARSLPTAGKIAGLFEEEPDDLLEPDSRMNMHNILSKSPYNAQMIIESQENATYIPTPVGKNIKPTGILKTNNSNLNRPSTSSIPEYKPTPISKLRELKYSHTPTETTDFNSSTSVRRRKKMEEYDPTEVKCIPKKSVTFADQAGAAINSFSAPVITLESSDDDIDDSASAPKFSDDDLDEEEPAQSKKTFSPESDADKNIEQTEKPKAEKLSLVDKILDDSKKIDNLLNSFRKPVPSSRTAISSDIQSTESSVLSYSNKDTDIGDKKHLSKMNSVQNEVKIADSFLLDPIFIISDNDDKSQVKLEIVDKKKEISDKKKEVSDKKKEVSDKKKEVLEKNLKHKKSHKSDKKHNSEVSKIKSKKHNESVSSKTEKSLSGKHNEKSKHKSSTSSNKSDLCEKSSLKSHRTKPSIPLEKEKSLKRKHTSSDKGQKTKSHSSKECDNISKKIKHDSKTNHSASSDSDSCKRNKHTSSQHSINGKRKNEHNEILTDKNKLFSPDVKKAKVNYNSNLHDDDVEDSFHCPISSDSESDLDEQCRRIFNETFPESSDVSQGISIQDSMKESLEVKDISVLRKKRLAHAGATALKKPNGNKVDVKRPLNPTQVMINRFAQIQAKQVQKNDQKSLPFNSPGRNPDKKRISIAPNPGLLAAITQKNMLNQGVSSLEKFSPLPPTVSKSLKITKRIAHVPEAALKPRPIIPAEYGSKVPANVRQKFLNAFIDECLKFCAAEDEAYSSALAEEKIAYDRSSCKAVYMNVAANTLKRLRNTASAGPDQQSSQKTGRESDSKKTVSHQTMLNGPMAQRTSFSIGRKREVPEIKGGAALYEYLLPYVLSQEQLRENGFPRPHPTESGRAIIEGVYANRTHYSNDPFKRTCCRCQKVYYVNVEGDYVREEECDYHWGRLWKRRIAGAIESRYSCCQGDSESDGCCVSAGHVFEGSEAHALRGFVKTQPKPLPPDKCHGIYALDCEMCYTTAGMELTRITVINSDLKPAFESFVKPQNRVLDYNTRFSGVTEEDLKNVKTMLPDIQDILLSLFNSRTMLIGHSLESDFKALKLFHDTVIDTSVVFPHKNGLPFKRALRTLMVENLNKIIQNDVGGHDSQEDAAACMELMLWKIKEDIKSNR